MLNFRISETSSRIPVALFVLELMVFFTAVLSTAYLEVFPRTRLEDGLGQWLLRALLFGAVMIVCMAVFKLYQGRPGEGVAKGLLRLAVSFALGGLILQGLYLLAPVLYIEPAALATMMVFSFFFLGTVRPVFLDSVTERHGRRRLREPAAAGAPEGEEGDMSQEEFLKRLSDNAPGTTSLTGQHRIRGRGL